MRKYIIFFVLILVSMKLTYSQTLNSNNGSNFNIFLGLFKIIDLPFVVDYASDQSTEFGESRRIPEEMYKKYICNQGIPCNLTYCPQDFFHGFDALCQLKTNKNFYSLLLAINTTNEGCEQIWYLVTYTREGQIIDYLPSFQLKVIKEDSKEDPTRIFCKIESRTYADSVIIQNKTTTGFNGKIVSKNVLKIKYIITSEGKFIKEYEREVK